MQAEAKGDIEGVVATLTEKPRYLAHDVPEMEAMNPAGSKDAIRAFYEGKEGKRPELTGRIRLKEEDREFEETGT